MSGEHATTLIDPPVAAFLENTLGQGVRLDEIAGDASDRMFYRATTGKRTAVLIIHPVALAPDAPLFSNHRVMKSIGSFLSHIDRSCS